jgi:hypothetical protein
VWETRGGHHGLPAFLTTLARTPPLREWKESRERQAREWRESTQKPDQPEVLSWFMGFIRFALIWSYSHSLASFTGKVFLA